jgi:ABC-type transport system substrate-binding protein
VEGDQLIFDGLQQSGVFKPTAVRYTDQPAQRLCRSLRECSGFSETAIGEDVDYWLAEYSSTGARPGGEPAPIMIDPRIDRIKAAYRRELDPEKRGALLKELQPVLAEFMPAVPAIDLYGTFSFRWPWLHNINHGDPTGVYGRPIWGGHKQWLDAAMPRRNG